MHSFLTNTLELTPFSLPVPVLQPSPPPPAIRHQSGHTTEHGVYEGHRDSRLYHRKEFDLNFPLCSSETFFSSDSAGSAAAGPSLASALSAFPEQTSKKVRKNGIRKVSASASASASAAVRSDATASAEIWLFVAAAHQSLQPNAIFAHWLRKHAAASRLSPVLAADCIFEAAMMRGEAHSVAAAVMV